MRPICPDCKYEPPASRIPFGTPIEFMPGATVHSADCPQVAWMEETRKRILPELIEMERALRRGAGEAHLFVIGGAA